MDLELRKRAKVHHGSSLLATLLPELWKRLIDAILIAHSDCPLVGSPFASVRKHAGVANVPILVEKIVMRFRSRRYHYYAHASWSYYNDPSFEEIKGRNLHLHYDRRTGVYSDQPLPRQDAAYPLPFTFTITMDFRLTRGKRVQTTAWAPGPKQRRVLKSYNPYHVRVPSEEENYEADSYVDDLDTSMEPTSRPAPLPVEVGPRAADLPNTPPPRQIMRANPSPQTSAIRDTLPPDGGNSSRNREHDDDLRYHRSQSNQRPETPRREDDVRTRTERNYDSPRGGYRRNSRERPYASRGDQRNTRDCRERSPLTSSYHSRRVFAERDTEMEDRYSRPPTDRDVHKEIRREDQERCRPLVDQQDETRLQIVEKYIKDSQASINEIKGFAEKYEEMMRGWKKMEAHTNNLQDALIQLQLKST